jgi:hypothetical protein
VFRNFNSGKTMHLKFAFSFLALVFLTTTTFGDIVYDEGISGDLSGAFGSPTSITFSAQSNTVIGQMGENGGTGGTNGRDADYFTFSFGGGRQLTSVTIDSYTFSPNNPGSSFMGYVAGTAFAGQGGGDIDGNVLFNAGSGDVLPSLGGPLDAGDYSFWVQETSANAVDYTITFGFTAVPEPAGMVVCGIALMSLVSRRRRAGK